VVLSAAVIVVAVAIALAALPPKPAPPALFHAPQEAALPTDAGIPSAALPSRPAGPSRREVLLTLANDALAGAPNPLIVERRGNDARLVAWNPGDTLRLVRTFRDAFSADSQFAFVSPDGRSIVVADFQNAGVETSDVAKLVTADGRIAWESHTISTGRGVIWASDSRQLAMVDSTDHWIVVTMRSDGVAKEKRLEVTGGTSPGVPGPSPSATASTLMPVAFSADGLTLYGAPVEGRSGSVRPTVRVTIASGAVEAISSATTRGPTRIGLGDGRGGLDPTTGRAIRWGSNASIPGGPPTLEVIETDGSLAYRVEVGVVLGANWEASGQLLILAADGFPFPTQLRLLRVASDGTVGDPVLTTGSVAWGELLGARDGFAVLALATRQPTETTQLVVVNLADTRAAGLTLPPDQGRILGAGLLP
jgi:hypothetical protein